MEKIISISFGELFLKGKNRRQFIDLAKKNISQATSDLAIEKMYTDHGKYYIKAEEADFDRLIGRLEKVFGISHINPTISCEKTLDAMKEAVYEYISTYARDAKTFKIAAKRADKSFKPKSPELNQIFGGFVLKNFSHLKVDVHQPDLELAIDIRKDRAYIYGEKFEGAGGLPVGSSGRGLSLLSGGIDSPVASYMMGKRGVRVHMVHYNSYPFTSDRSLEKVKKLAQILATYLGPIKFYNVNILEIQKQINSQCQEKNMTILSRRFMMRIADKIARDQGYQMLVTGESLGQVASQTIEGLTATNAVTQTPVMRPLIGMDKEEIIGISKKIQTYPTSILPYEDCCTVFQPSSPNIKPSLRELEEEEERLAVQDLVDEAVDQKEIFEIKPAY